MTKEPELFGYRMPPKKELEKVTKRLLESSKKQAITIADKPFLLKWDEFGKELIKKSNEIFKIPPTKNWRGEEFEDNEELGELCILRRLALITTIYKNPQLRSANLWPITPLQSEQLLKQKKLPRQEEYCEEYCEDLAFILYNANVATTNELEAISLKESIKKHRSGLGLNKSDLEKGLLIINAGAEKDDGYAWGIKPIIIPGLTQIYLHETLEKKGQYSFKYGLKYGIPSTKELGKGNRMLFLGPKEGRGGLRMLYRDKDLNLSIRDDQLNFFDPDRKFKVCFARQKK